MLIEHSVNGHMPFQGRPIPPEHLSVIRGALGRVWDEELARQRAAEEEIERKAAIAKARLKKGKDVASKANEDDGSGEDKPDELGRTRWPRGDGARSYNVWQRELETSLLSLRVNYGGSSTAGSRPSSGTNMLRSRPGSRGSSRSGSRPNSRPGSSQPSRACCLLPGARQTWVPRRETNTRRSDCSQWPLV